MNRKNISVAVLFLLGLALAGGCKKSEKAAPPASESGKLDEEKPALSPKGVAQSRSPFLRGQAEHPVKWVGWSEAALTQAVRDDKSIFLLIGFYPCAACEQVLHTELARPGVVEVLNRDYLPILVDLDQHPEVAGLYMEAARAMAGKELGWPLSAVCMPDGRPVTAGDQFNEKLADALAEGAQTYRNQIEKYEHSARQIQEEMAGRAKLSPMGIPPRKVVDLACGAIEEHYDFENGGLKKLEKQAKIPLLTLGLLLADAARLRKEPHRSNYLKMAKLQADRMAAGAVVDQVGGGLFRMCNDAAWGEPVFDKWIYDQADLLSFYSRLHRLEPSPAYARVVARAVGFLETDLLDSGGLFYTRLGYLDSQQAEGYYHWTPAEVRKVLGKDAPAVLKLMGAPQEAQAEFVPALASPDKETAAKWEAARGKLESHRKSRTRPPRNEMMITAANGLMVVGLVDAAETFKEKRYRELALGALEQLRSRSKLKNGRLVRYLIGGRKVGAGRADDYAAVILALVSGFRLNPDPNYLWEAKQLAGILQERFWDEETKGFFHSGPKRHLLFAPYKDSIDHALPSANSLAARALVELALVTREKKYADTAVELFEAFSQVLSDRILSLTGMVRALERSFAKQQ